MSRMEEFSFNSSLKGIAMKTTTQSRSAGTVRATPINTVAGQGGRNNGEQKKGKQKERVIVTAGTRTCRTCDSSR